MDIFTELLPEIEKLASLMEAEPNKVVTAESCTGGLIAAALTSYPGASAWFDRGFVTYTNESKNELLGVPKVLFDEFGAVSEECVFSMLNGALNNSKGTMAVAVSGIAGPTGAVPGKPVGTVFIGWTYRGKAKVKRFQFSGDRNEVRMQAVREGIKGLIEIAQGKGN